MNMDINFPNLHLSFAHVGQSVTIFGFPIAYYGICIALGMLLGVSLILFRARKAGESQDDFLDICIYTIIFSVIGARLYYVIFRWDAYRDNPLDILNIRQGGLAIYGGVLAGIFTAYIMCRIKRLAFWKAADIIIPGLVVGQILGRWGNFFNREVFGQYTDQLLAMELPLNAVRSMDDITEEMLAHSRVVEGVTYVQVHPTFLYESLWNLLLLFFLLFMTKRKRFDGELFLYYLFFYGLGRFWIEGMRTDQLKMIGWDVPVSMVVAAVLMIISAAVYFWKRKEKSAKKTIKYL